MADVANAVGEIGRADRSDHVPRAPLSEPPAPAPAEPSQPLVEPEAYWRKHTVPYRAEQLARLDTVLNRWAAEKQIRISAAEVIRYAVDEMIERMGSDPDAVILALFHQERREERDVPTRKFSRSRGAERYLKEKNLL